MSVDNKKTLLIIALLCAAFFIHYRKVDIESIPDNPVVVVPEPVNPQPPSPLPEEKGCDLSLAEALRVKKPLLIVFVADWCGFCKSLKNDLPNINNVDQYIICLTDIDNESNKELVAHFGIKMIPTVIMIDPEQNKEIKRIAGYDKIKFSSWLNR
jgi:thioredoxin-related protein